MSPEGVFTHSVKKPRQRFLEVADRLLSGRICIACMSSSAAKIGCVIGIKYSQKRFTVGPTGESDTAIFDYQLQQNSLFPLLAKTICLQIGLNHIKDNYEQFYIHNKGDHNELVRQCCVIKPMITWNLAEVGSVCRERCGGQGYLSVNRLGDLLAFAHAGITAEGDNRVLIQKVTKEYTTDVAKGKIEQPAMTMCPEKELPKLKKLDNLDVIQNLLAYRLITLSTELMGRMQKKIMEDGQPLFDVWMKQESDLIQATGTSYGEHLVFKACVDMHKKGNYGMTNGKVMENVIMVFGFSLIERDLGWYLSNGVINAEAGKGLSDVRSKYVKNMAPNASDLIDGFGIESVYAPIATDYEEYNSKPNFGEHGPLPKL